MWAPSRSKGPRMSHRVEEHLGLFLDNRAVLGHHTVSKPPQKAPSAPPPPRAKGMSALSRRRAVSKVVWPTSAVPIAAEINAGGTPPSSARSSPNLFVKSSPRRPRSERHPANPGRRPKCPCLRRCRLPLHTPVTLSASFARRRPNDAKVKDQWRRSSERPMCAT